MCAELRDSHWIIPACLQRFLDYLSPDNCRNQASTLIEDWPTARVNEGYGDSPSPHKGSN